MLPVDGKVLVVENLDITEIPIELIDAMKTETINSVDIVGNVSDGSIDADTTIYVKKPDAVTYVKIWFE